MDKLPNDAKKGDAFPAVWIESRKDAAAEFPPGLLQKWEKMIFVYSAQKSMRTNGQQNRFDSDLPETGNILMQFITK